MVSGILFEANLDSDFLCVTTLLLDRSPLVIQWIYCSLLLKYFNLRSDATHIHYAFGRVYESSVRFHNWPIVETMQANTTWVVMRAADPDEDSWIFDYLHKLQFPHLDRSQIVYVTHIR